MKKVKPGKIYYEIEKKLGDGLTSEVYKAFRIEASSGTRQLVALKIIKSEKDVQILKMEFEKLLKVRSQYCVRVYAWESLPQGSAIVLEYIDGVTLSQLVQENLLNGNLISQIYRKVERGLKDLHKQKIIHGDLNLKNILVTNRGEIKLIDFGFYVSDSEKWLTPEFASPTLLKGGAATATTDLESLLKIKKYLFKNLAERGGAESAPVFPYYKDGRQDLAQRVQWLQNRKDPSTRLLQSSIQHKTFTKNRFKTPLFLIFFILLLFFPDAYFTSHHTGELEIRTTSWLGYSLNGMPYEYRPTELRPLRVGFYKISLLNKKGEEKATVAIKSGERFLLNPHLNNL